MCVEGVGVRVKGGVEEVVVGVGWLVVGGGGVLKLNRR